MGRFADLPDEQLLALTPRHPDAFGTFYERHLRLVMGYLVRATGDAEQALDLTAEVFAAALVAAVESTEGARLTPRLRQQSLVRRIPPDRFHTHTLHQPPGL